MIDIIINIGEVLSPIFYKVLYMSIVGSLVGAVIFTLIKIFDNKLSAKVKCIMWIAPIVFLLMPINRIEINTNKDIAVTTPVDRVETALNNVSKISYSKSSDNNIKEEKMTKSSYTKKQIVYKLTPVVWITVSSFGVLVFMLGNININIKINMAKRCRDIRIKEILNSCRQRLNVNKRIGIKFQDFNGSPYIYGILYPKIILPSDFIEKDDVTLENIFLHELSHYKRKDMITNYILLAITLVHWFNPFVHYLFKKIRQDMEIATDEIALNKMNKEEKKKYGMTLINLLETYENPKASLKVLCITDDNKNMERRIKKIKLSTKLKKYQKSIMILITAIVICVLSPFVLKTTSIATNVEDEKMYQKVKDYLIAVEEKNHQTERKEFDVNGDNFKTFVDIAKLGIKQNEDETYVYVWALIKSYYEQEEVVNTESSIPYKFTIKNGEVIKCEFPEDGENYDKSIEEIFPEEIRKDLEKGKKQVDRDKLEKEAIEYYESLGKVDYIQGGVNQAAAGTPKTEYYNVIDSLEGEWKPYKAEIDGEEVGLSSIYGTSIKYGGSLILNSDRTYTEFIGGYSPDIIDTLRGEYKIGTEEETAEYYIQIALIPIEGKPKALVYLRNENVIVEELEDGKYVYFTK